MKEIEKIREFLFAIQALSNNDNVALATYKIEEQLKILEARLEGSENKNE